MEGDLRDHQEPCHDQVERNLKAGTSVEILETWIEEKWRGGAFGANGSTVAPGNKSRLKGKEDTKRACRVLNIAGS